jgi:uncharacterized membrane protein required for colicin V production
MMILILVGYQTPYQKLNFKNQITTNSKVEHFAGFIIGALNGFLIVGTIWYFLHQANYPGEALFSPTEGMSAALNEKAMKLIEFLPPSWLQGTVLYVMVAFLVIFILIMIV